MNHNQQRLLILLSALGLFIIGFVFSFVYYPPVFDLSIRVIINMQASITNKGFIVFMNIISNLFNPVVCAGYILILYLLTARKL
jgi:capsular polysaccharide biosynthesis protein